MDNTSGIVNKVAQSGIMTIDLEELYPAGARVIFDLKEFLFEELILREKDFREKLKNHDWASYLDKFVAITNSADAIVPTWAYMLVASELEPFAKKTIFGTVSQLEDFLFNEIISAIDPMEYKDKRVVIKGCSKVSVPVSAYIGITQKLRPVVKSIMYGEPCSTVPVYKKTSEANSL